MFEDCLVAKGIYKNRRDEDKAHDRFFFREDNKGRSMGARKRVARLRELRRLKEMDEDIYWDRLH